MCLPSQLLELSVPFDGSNQELAQSNPQVTTMTGTPTATDATIAERAPNSPEAPIIRNANKDTPPSHQRYG